MSSVFLKDIEVIISPQKKQAKEDTIKIRNGDETYILHRTGFEEHCKIYQLLPTEENDIVRFIQSIENKYGAEKFTRFCDLFRDRGPIYVTISHLAAFLNLDRNSTKAFIQECVSNGVMKKYFSYWKIDNDAKKQIIKIIMHVQKDA